MKRRILRKEFFVTLFIKQNNWHKYSVLVHSLKLTYLLAKNGYKGMILAGILHDIGKPIIAYQDDKDKTTGEYSFHNHEEISYHIIKNWPISDYTKNLVRYHYLLRGRLLAKKRNQYSKYIRLNRIYNSLDDNFKKDLGVFLKYDDYAKK